MKKHAEKNVNRVATCLVLWMWKSQLCVGRSEKNNSVECEMDDFRGKDEVLHKIQESDLTKTFLSLDFLPGLR